ncbi:MAG TPA: hypothetical protein VEX68_15015, partial [Bryobacteraceae bacterium]|nr:hypothetical protein [Bryobacteraceae bacterium]
MIDEAADEPFWSWTDLILFLGLGIPAFIATFVITQLGMMSVTNNKALLLMIPQFLAQAAMLIPIALL